MRIAPPAAGGSRAGATCGLAPRRLLLVVAALAALALVGCSEGEASDGGPAGGGGGDRTGASSRPPTAGAGLVAVPGIVREVGPSVVAVSVATGSGRGEGSGVIWSEDGVIVTNHHVVEGARSVRVGLATGERIGARVVAADPRTDLAVLRVDRDGLPAAGFADRLPAPGELAVALGNPLGFEDTVTAGVVSGIDRALPTGGRTPALVGLIQTDAPISPGNSGGALVNGDGRVIGINVAFIPPEARAVSIGFAIPAPLVQDVVRELLRDGEVEHAFLGVTVNQVTPTISEQLDLGPERGALVLQVAEGSPAEEAGLRRGDVIVGAGGEPVEEVEDLFGALRTREPGDELRLTVVRKGERRELTATLAERPEALTGG